MGKQTKSNSAVIVVLVIFVLATLGLGAYIALDKTVLHRDEVCTNNGSNAETQEEITTTPDTPQATPAVVDTPTVSSNAEKHSYIVDGNFSSVVYSSSKDKAYLWNRNYRTKSDFNNDFDVADEPKTLVSFTDIGFKGDKDMGFIGDDEMYDKTFVYEMDLSDFKSIYYVSYGNGIPADHYIFVMNDGTISMLTFAPGMVGGNSKESAVMRIKNNVAGFTKVAGAETTMYGNGHDAMIFFEDGSMKKMPYDEFSL